MLVIGFRVSSRKIEWVPLLWAGFAFLVYVVLLKSRDLLPIPVYLEAVPLIWFGKILSLSGTIAILYFLPRASFRSAGPDLDSKRGLATPRHHYRRLHDHWRNCHHLLFNIRPRYFPGKPAVPGNPAGC